jgi:hypothetical protein
MSDDDARDHGDRQAQSCAGCGAALGQGQPFCTSCGASVESPAGAAGGGGDGSLAPALRRWWRGLEVTQKRVLVGMVALLVLVIVVVAATSGGEGDEIASVPIEDAAATPPTTFVTTTSTTQPGLAGVVGTWTITATNSEGYAATAVLEVGAPERPTAGTGSACGANAQTDAIVPARLTLTNTTAGFSAVIGFSLDRVQGTDFRYFDFVPDEDLPLPVAAPGQRNDLWVGSAVEYSDGPSCNTGDPDEMFDSMFEILYQSNPLEPNQSATTEFEFVVRDYFTPQLSGGDSGSFGLVYVQPVLRIGTDTFGAGPALPTIDGPGLVSIDARPFPRHVLPLDGG